MLARHITSPHACDFVCLMQGRVSKCVCGVRNKMNFSFAVLSPMKIITALLLAVPFASAGTSSACMPSVGTVLPCRPKVTSPPSCAASQATHKNTNQSTNQLNASIGTAVHAHLSKKQPLCPQLSRLCWRALTWLACQAVERHCLKGPRWLHLPSVQPDRLHTKHTRYFFKQAHA